jgi:hypothetical protein
MTSTNPFFDLIAFQVRATATAGGVATTHRPKNEKQKNAQGT